MLIARSLAALIVVAPAIAIAAPVTVPLAATAGRVIADPRLDATQPATGAVCSGGEIRCRAHVVTQTTGQIHAFAAPVGWGPQELRSAYQIDTAAQLPATIAIVDAYGYPSLESDLAIYRQQFGLPPCTQSNGCLRVVNQRGQSSPLPVPPTPDFDWTMETALDIQMVSAVCPSCRILVVQADDNSFDAMYAALFQAMAMRPAVVSNSWGATEAEVNVPALEAKLAQHPGIGVFAATGDSGFQSGGAGPDYPSTSPRVIAVGGTVLSRSTNARGWAEVAWPMAGSSCSDTLPRLATQATTACPRRAASDLSAVAGAPGLAVFNTHEGGWIAMQGTSASAPLVATMFAARGLGDVVPEEIAALAGSFHDITVGNNGSCNNNLCNAGPGWDGPTGFGTPDVGKLGGGGGQDGEDGEDGASVDVTAPLPGAVVEPGFDVVLDVTGSIAITVKLDGVVVGTVSAPPYRVSTPASTPPGPHVVTVTVQDSTGEEFTDTIPVTVSGPAAPGSGPGSGPGSDIAPGETRTDGGCTASGGAGFALPLLGLALALARRQLRAPRRRAMR
jgi:hypothetical protein